MHLVSNWISTGDRNLFQLFINIGYFYLLFFTVFYVSSRCQLPHFLEPPIQRHSFWQCISSSPLLLVSPFYSNFNFKPRRTLQQSSNLIVRLSSFLPSFFPAFFSYTLSPCILICSQNECANWPLSVVYDTADYQRLLPPISQWNCFSSSNPPGKSILFY